MNIGKIQEKFTADYDCRAGTVHIFSVATKNGNRTLKEKILYIKEKVAKGSMDAKLLEAACSRRTRL